MKRILLLSTVFIGLFAAAQNPYTSVVKYLTGDCTKPDTTISTTVITGKSGYFSSKVNQTATTTIIIKKYKDPVIVTPPTNLPPTVTITGVTEITLPANSVTLTANATDPDGTIAKRSWVKVSGSVATINSPAGSSTLISGLTDGTYLFSVTVTDNAGATTTANLTVTVKPAVIVTPPPVDTTTGPGPNPEPWGKPYFSTSFESTPVTQGFNTYVAAPNKTDVSVSTAEAHTGNSSARFHLNESDALKTGTKRAEMTLLPNDGKNDNEPTIVEGSERAYRFWIKIPSGFRNDREESLFQEHHSASDKSPPAALYISGGKYAWDFIRVYGGDEKNDDIIAYKTGVWQEITIHMKFSSTSAGLSEVWIDGYKYTNQGANMFSGQTNYTKVGVYAWIMLLSGGMVNKDQVFFYDDFAYWVIK